MKQAAAWHVTSAPSAQNALDLFKDEWSSRLPDALGRVEAGSSKLFEDERITWAAEQFGGIQGRRILELGPLEGGHTYMMQQLGAASITAIEMNASAYLKCLIVKELLQVKSARFLLGDFVKYLRDASERFDICFASGVLDNMVNPVELIGLISRVANRLFLWTHYYDPAIVEARPRLAARFSERLDSEHDRFEHALYPYQYGDALEWLGFCGGSLPYSNWMSREDILACLSYYGYTECRVGLEASDHPNGPCFCVAAMKPAGSQDARDQLAQTQAELQRTRIQLRRAKRKIAELEEGQRERSVSLLERLAGGLQPRRHRTIPSR